MQKIDLQRLDFSKLTTAKRQQLARDLEALELMELRESFAAPGGLLKFVRHFWPVLEPDAKFKEDWAIEAMALISKRLPAAR